MGFCLIYTLGPLALAWHLQVDLRDALTGEFPKISLSTAHGVVDLEVVLGSTQIKSIVHPADTSVFRLPGKEI